MDIFHMDNNICNPKEASKWTQSPYGDHLRSILNAGLISSF